MKDRLKALVLALMLMVAGAGPVTGQILKPFECETCHELEEQDCRKPDFGTPDEICWEYRDPEEPENDYCESFGVGPEECDEGGVALAAMSLSATGTRAIAGSQLHYALLLRAAARPEAESTEYVRNCRDFIVARELSGSGRQEVHRATRSIVL